MKTKFTIEGYTELLKYFKKTHNYTTFSEYDQTTKESTILLRHDIDYSLKYAYEFAKIEKSLGIKSTYFLLFSTPFYNILDEENIKLAKKITQLGHEVGLHYDVNVISKGNNKDPHSLFNAKINLLSNLIEKPITAIAMHNPSISGEDIFHETNYVNVYDKKFIKDIDYFSDSCCAWRNNFIEHIEQNNFPKKLQLLIHPILWSEIELDRYSKLDNFLQMKITESSNMIDSVKELWKNHSGVIEHDLRVSKVKEETNANKT